MTEGKLAHNHEFTADEGPAIEGTQPVMLILEGNCPACQELKRTIFTES